jgi:hypothetical protein
MSDIEISHPYRDKFPQMSDDEFVKHVQVEEAVAALSIYLRERVAGLGPHMDEEQRFEHNPHFPYSITNTAYEIAHIVISSFGSFEAIESQETQAES